MINYGGDSAGADANKRMYSKQKKVREGLGLTTI